MSPQMLTESLINDKNFIRKQLKYVPKKFWIFLSRDEIESELNLAIFNCSKTYNIKLGTMFGFVKHAFINNLNNALRDKSFYMEMEVPISAAYNMQCKEESRDSIELMSYISELPTELVIALTDFLLGQKNKEEIVSNPSFKKINVDRILSKLDSFFS